MKIIMQHKCFHDRYAHEKLYRNNLSSKRGQRNMYAQMPTTAHSLPTHISKYIEKKNSYDHCKQIYHIMKRDMENFMGSSC